MKEYRILYRREDGSWWVSNRPFSEDEALAGGAFLKEQEGVVEVRLEERRPIGNAGAFTGWMRYGHS